MKTIIKNATILDMVGDTPNIKHGDVLIEDGIIQEISSSISKEDCEVIDANGKVLMPGFVNTHTHLGMSIFRGYQDDQKLMDWLTKAIFPIEDQLTGEEIYWNSYLSCLEMIASGTTCCNDMYFRMERVIDALNDSGVRGLVSWCFTDDSIRDKVEKTRKYASFYNHPDSRIKICVSAHAPYTCNPDTMKLCLDLAKEIDSPIHVHLAETQDEIDTIQKTYGKSPTQYLKDLGILDVPVILAHGIYLSDEDISLLKNIHGGISHNPISNCKLSSGICDVANLHKNNLLVGIGTDGVGSTTTLDMFEEMRLTAYLQKVNTLNPTTIDAYTILKMATIDGAKVLGFDSEIGTIEVGKRADLILIDMDSLHLFPNNDICANLVYSANGADVDMVMVDGKVLMKDKKLLDPNLNKVKEEVLKITNKYIKN